MAKSEGKGGEERRRPKVVRDRPLYIGNELYNSGILRRIFKEIIDIIASKGDDSRDPVIR